MSLRTGKRLHAGLEEDAEFADQRRKGLFWTLKVDNNDGHGFKWFIIHESLG